jgi:hypothetical protein
LVVEQDRKTGEKTRGRFICLVKSPFGFCKYPKYPSPVNDTLFSKKAARKDTIPWNDFGIFLFLPVSEPGTYYHV